MKLKNLILGFGIAGIVLAAQSCEKHDYIDPIIPNAVVTIKPSADQSFIMQLDDSTTMKATNISKSPYGDKKVRAIVSINHEDLKNIINDKNRTSENKQYDVKINYIDSIRTKGLSPNLFEKNIETYGNSPIDLVNSYETVVEDGYLTLRFRTNWGHEPHVLSLVATHPDDPYTLTLYHKNKDEYSNMWGDGLIAFDLSTLPDTEGKFVTLSLNWQAYRGAQTITFKYKTIK